MIHSGYRSETSNPKLDSKNFLQMHFRPRAKNELRKAKALVAQHSDDHLEDYGDEGQPFSEARGEKEFKESRTGFGRHCPYEWIENLPYLNCQSYVWWKDRVLLEIEMRNLSSKEAALALVYGVPQNIKIHLTRWGRANRRSWDLDKCFTKIKLILGLTDNYLLGQINIASIHDFPDFETFILYLDMTFAELQKDRRTWNASMTNEILAKFPHCQQRALNEQFEFQGWTKNPHLIKIIEAMEDPYIKEAFEKIFLDALSSMTTPDLPPPRIKGPKIVESFLVNNPYLADHALEKNPCYSIQSLHDQLSAQPVKPMQEQKRFRVFRAERSQLAMKSNVIVGSLSNSESPYICLDNCKIVVDSDADVDLMNVITARRLKLRQRDCHEGNYQIKFYESVIGMDRKVTVFYELPGYPRLKAKNVYLARMKYDLLIGSKTLTQAAEDIAHAASCSVPLNHR